MSYRQPPFRHKTMKNKRKLQKIVAALNAAGIPATLGDGEYLIRFEAPATDQDPDDVYPPNNLVLMSDMGVTWEPWRAYPTPCYCVLDLNDEFLVAKMVRLATLWRDGKLAAQCKTGRYQKLIDKVKPRT